MEVTLRIVVFAVVTLLVIVVLLLMIVNLTGGSSNTINSVFDSISKILGTAKK
jgi:ABC-type transporter Mla subunit MlaD